MISSKRKEFKSPQLWKDRMRDVPCFILGNAPSLKYADLSLIDGYFSVGINRIFKIYEPTVLLWQDWHTWRTEKEGILKCNSIKYCPKCDLWYNKDFYYFTLKDNRTLSNKGLSNSTAILHGYGITTKITFQFVCALGCNPIIFVGTDGTYDKNGDTNFYGVNKFHRPDNPDRFQKALKFIIKNKRDKTIINCCPNPILGKTHTIKEAIEMIKEKPKKQSDWKKQLLYGTEIKEKMKCLI